MKIFVFVFRSPWYITLDRFWKMNRKKSQSVLYLFSTQIKRSWKLHPQRRQQQGALGVRAGEVKPGKTSEMIISSFRS